VILSHLNSFSRKEKISELKETNLKLETAEYQGARFQVTMETTKDIGYGVCYCGEELLSLELHYKENFWYSLNINLILMTWEEVLFLVFVVNSFFTWVEQLVFKFPSCANNVIYIVFFGL
jgi:hypothetical protein